VKKIKVVIVGGGFGGVSVAKKLTRASHWRKNLSITLISRSRVSLFTPLLHEVATGGLREDGVGQSLASMFSKHDIELHYESITKVDIEKRELRTDMDKRLAYDFLVLATGSKPNFFGTKGAGEYAYTLKTIEDATKMREAICMASQKENPSFVVVGGGPTGVELVAEMRHFLDYLCKNSKVTLIQKGEELIPMFPPKFRILAKKRLEKLGINVVMNTGVTEICKDGVILDDGLQIPSHLTAWTAGVMTDIPEMSGSRIEAQKGRLPVDSKLRLQGEKNVFVIGDIAGFTNAGEDRPVPQLAQVATRQGPIVAKNIIATLEGKELTDYKFVSAGLLLSLGEWMAVAQLKSLFLSGRFAWLLWRAIYLSKIETIPGKLHILYDWIRCLVFSRRK